LDADPPAQGVKIARRLTLDEIRDLRAFEQHLEDATEASAIPAAWRCGQAEHNRVRVLLENRSIGRRACVVRLIDDEEIGGRHRHRRRADGACVKRLD
jgi:hypothetical protein